MARSNLSLDHIIIAVKGLDAAIEYYKALGLSAFYGGKHADGNTHNALIVFGDGTYIELIAPTDPQMFDRPHEIEEQSFLSLFSAGEGFAGFALLSKDIDAEIVSARSRGVAIDDARDGGRQRPDGQQLKWRSAAVEGKYSPFLIADLTPREFRVPNDADKIDHANGVVGVVSVVMLVEDLAASARRYEALLGVAPENGSPVEGASTLNFSLDNCTVTVAAPADPSVRVFNELSRRGEVPYLLRLHTLDHNHAGLLDTRQTHEARIELVSR